MPETKQSGVQHCVFSRNTHTWIPASQHSSPCVHLGNNESRQQRGIEGRGDEVVKGSPTVEVVARAQKNAAHLC